MEMRTGRVPGRSHVPDRLTLGDDLADAATDARLVGVGRGRAVAMVDDHEVAVAAVVPPSEADDAALGGSDRGPGVHADVDARLEATSTRSELRRHRAVNRPPEAQQRLESCAPAGRGARGG